MKEHESFIGCARQLLLNGKRLADICEYNASICCKYGKHNATTLWNLIKIFYGTTEFSHPKKCEHRNANCIQKNCVNSRRPNSNVNSNTLIKWEQNENISLSDLDDHAVMKVDDSILEDVNGSDSETTYPSHGSVILSDNQLLAEITFDNFDILRNGFIYVGPPDFTKVLTLPDTALHCNVQEARPQLDIKAEDCDKSPVNLKIQLIFYAFILIIP